MKTLEIIPSADNRVLKYVFELEDGKVVEASAIRRHSIGKWSICLPSQVGCAMKCKFCHLSNATNQVRNLTADEMVEMVYRINEHYPHKSSVLLVSFMGSGEPLLNADNVVSAMKLIKALLLGWGGDPYTLRFALASMMPTQTHFSYFISLLGKHRLNNVKFHLSLHHHDYTFRREMIPGSKVIPFRALQLLEEYNHAGFGNVELHYTLIDGVNDTNADLKFLELAQLPICFIVFNPGANDLFKPSPRLQEFITRLKVAGLTVESYAPPGADIGASCGQFNLKYYQGAAE